MLGELIERLSKLYRQLTDTFKKTGDEAIKFQMIEIGNELDKIKDSIVIGNKPITNLPTSKLSSLDETLNKISKQIDEADARRVTREAQDSVDKSIKMISEKTGLSIEESRLAVMEKINEGYPVGDLKRTAPNDMAQISAYLDNNLNYSASDAATFLEDIEEIAFSGAIDLSSDAAKNVSKQKAINIIASGDDETAKGFAKPVDIGVSDDLQKSLELSDSYGFQVTKDADDVVPYSELSSKDIEMVKLGVPMNSKKYRKEMELIDKGEMAPSQMSGISEAQRKGMKMLEDTLLGGVDMKTYKKINEAEGAEARRIQTEIEALLDEGRNAEAEELYNMFNDPTKRTKNADGGRIKKFGGGSFNFAYGPIGDLGITREGLESLKNFDFSSLNKSMVDAKAKVETALAGRNPDGSPKQPNPTTDSDLYQQLLEKYRRPEGSANYNFPRASGQLAQDMADLGFVDNNPMTMEALTSKYTGFLNDLYGLTPSGGISTKLLGVGRPPFLPPPGMGNTPSTEPPLLGTAVVGPFRNPDGSPIVGYPEMFDNPPNYFETGPGDETNPNAPPADPNAPSLNPDAPGYLAETPVVEQPKYTPKFLSYDELKDKDRSDIIDYYRMLAGFKSGGQVKGVGSLFRKK